MPPKKAKNAANQHDKRHESGLAPPGRRITKQKSNPILNSYANGKTGPPNPPLSQDVNQHMTQQLAIPIDAPDGTHAQATMAGSVSGRPLEERGTYGSDVSLDCPDAYRFNTNGAFDHAPSGTPRRTDAHDNKIAPAYKGSSMLTIASTIISSCPLRDVLAILIILLQLPPTVLTIVQFLFATLTFVPPQAGTSLSALSSFPSFTDIFQGSGGTPSLFTIIFADAFILVLWLLLWVPVQNFFLDLAQAVIAIALGGAAAGKSGTTNSIFICFFIITFSHLFRFRPLRHQIVHFLWTGLARGGLDFLTSPPSALPFQESFQTPHGWTRTVLGIHILAQGVVRMIRRSLSRREASHSIPTSKGSDPEAAVHHLPRSTTTSIDSNVDLPSSSSTDGRPPGPSPATGSHKEKALSSRKKRKQATHVRSQQPFWAALASTKVTVLKEMESGRAANDASEANAKDSNHIGNAVWGSEEDRVWISEIGSTGISFRVSMYAGDEYGLSREGSDGDSVSGIDKSKPFYIRVNGADWSSARIRQGTTAGYSGEEGTGVWVGEVFGLTALSNYFVEFVRTSDHEPFYSTSLITSAGPSAEQASIASPPVHPTLRPSSPTTTLKNSIAAADQKLQDQRNRLKRNRKDHKAAITALKKELEALTNRFANAGGSDERQRQRVLQFTQSIKQAEEAAADLEIQIDLLGDVPEEESLEAKTVKKEWKKERDQKDSALTELENAKTNVDRQILGIESDISSVIQKRERLQQRQSRVNEQHEKLTAANQEEHSVKARKQRERERELQRRNDLESQYIAGINNFERRLAECNNSTAQLMQTIRHLEALLLQQLQQQSVPGTPEGPLPGTTTIPPSVAFSGFTYPSLTSHVNTTPGSMRNGRGRSSSMLSNISGFTDGFEEGPVSPSVPVLTNPFHSVHLINGRKRSHGSGSGSSGSSSQSSSQRDPLSPVPNVKPMMSRSPANGATGLAVGPIGGHR